MKFIATFSSRAAVVCVLAGTACENTDDAAAASAPQGTTLEVASAVSVLPTKAWKLSDALGGAEAKFATRGGCGSPGGCGATGERSVVSGPMMMPAPGPSMMGSARAKTGVGEASSQEGIETSDGTRPQQGAKEGTQVGEVAVIQRYEGAAGQKGEEPNKEVGSSTSWTDHVQAVGTVDFFLDQAKSLGLSVQQQQALGGIKRNALRAVADANREFESAEEDLWQLTSVGEPDIGKIDKQIETISRIAARRRANYIMAVASAAKSLTEEQLAKLGESKDNAAHGMQMGDKPGMQMGAKPSMQMGEKPSTQMGDKPSMQMGAKPSMQMGDKPGIQMGAKPGMQMGAKPGKQMGAKPDMQMGAKPGKQMVAKPGKQMVAKPGKQMAAKPSTQMSMGPALMGRSPALRAKGSVGLTAALPGFPGRSHLYHLGATGFFLDHSEHLQLTDLQQAELSKIQKEAQAKADEVASRVIVAERELFVLTSESSMTHERVTDAVDRITRLHAEARLLFIQAVGKAASTLTEAQRNALVGASAHEDTAMAPPEEQ